MGEGQLGYGSGGRRRPGGHAHDEALDCQQWGVVSGQRCVGLIHCRCRSPRQAAVIATLGTWRSAYVGIAAAAASPRIGRPCARAIK